MRGLAMVLVLASCYAPDAADCSYKCSAGDCPVGLTCVQGFCRAPGVNAACSTGDGGTTGRPYVTAVLQSDPLVYWRLSDMAGSTTVKDEMGNANATNSGATLGVVGFMGNDGAASFVPTDCMNAGPFARTDFTPPSDFTLEAWIGFAAGSGDRTIVGKLAGSGASETGWDLRIALDEALELRACNGATCSTLKSVASVGMNRWWYVAATYRGATGAATLYVDGVPNGVTTTFDTAPTASSASLTLGCVEAGNHLRGILDEVAIYERVLEPAEIATHYEVGK